MKNPVIENIIISYSEFEVNNENNVPVENSQLAEAKESLARARASLNESDLNDAITKIEALPDDEEKNKLKSEAQLIKNIINATEAVEVAEKSLNPDDWSKAVKLIADLPECEEKSALISRFSKLIEDNERRFNQLLLKLEEEIRKQKACGNSLSYLNVLEVNELSNRWDLLKNRDECKNRVIEVINVNNANVQHLRKQRIAEEEPEKIGFITRLTECLGGPVNLIRRSKAWGKHILNKIDKKQEKINKTSDENKKEKYQRCIDKYYNLYDQRDIVSGVKFYKSLNSINKLKPSIYKNGLSASKNRIQKKFINASIISTNELYKGVTKMYEKEKDLILSDVYRFRNIANQYLEMLSVSPVVDEEEFNKDVNDVKKFLNEALSSDAIENEEVLAYLEEVDNIVFYKNFYKDNKGYEYVDSDITEIENKLNDNLPYIKTHKQKKVA